MTAQEALIKIQQLFADAPIPPPASTPEQTPSVAPTEAPKEYTLADGSKIMIDKYEVGGTVMLVDTSGNSIAAPTGEYVLADGSILTVDESSKITAITIPETPATVEPIVETQQNPLAAQIQKLEAEIGVLKNLIGSTQNQFAEQHNQILGLKEVIIGLINTPSSDPIESSPNNFRHVESKQDKIAKYLEFVKTIKKN